LYSAFPTVTCNALGVEHVSEECRGTLCSRPFRLMQITGHAVQHADIPPPQSTSAHVCCGQTGGWIKMSLGTEVGLGLGDIVFIFDGR